MPISPGDKLGPYEILAPIGAGGMGEVYRARDTRLKRDVALKVLPGAFASEPDRLTRFQREAEVLASLNHPNIAAIYGIEHADGVHALAMEFVEGASPKGPLPFEEAWKICSQIAEALEYAHDKGVIHRDLKPANVMVTPDGVVKLLDFGLAKAMSAQREASPTSAAVENSPTLTMGATQAGVVLGTAAYMSPEQARGKNVDKRADVWAFGVVLYELLTGRRPFRGEDIGDILASVIKEEPDYAPVPVQAQRLVRRCLEKDPKKRLRDISAAPDLLAAEPAPAAAASGASTLSRFRLAGWIAAAGVLAVTAAIAGYGWWRATRPVDKPLVRVSVDLGPEAVRGQIGTAILSPDGTRLVYVGSAPGGLTRLFTRRLDQAEATPLTGTESSSALQPFFSPDGHWIGFTVSGVLKKIAAEGGSPVTLGPAGIWGASWGDDGNIILGSLTGLRWVPEAGGMAQPFKHSGGVQVLPDVLPGAKAVLFTTATGVSSTSMNDNDIAVMTLPDGEVKTLLHGGYAPHYLPTSGGTGHLVYVHEGTMFAVAFDPDRLEVRGTPVPVLEGVAADPAALTGGGQFAVSKSGTLVYLSGKFSIAGQTMQWLDATGQTKPLVSQPGTYSAPRLSPDGQRLAYTAAGSKGTDVWVYDVGRGTPTQITFTGPGGRELAWAPDSKHLVFGDGTALWWIRADGSGQPQKVLDQANNPRPGFFTADGRLVYAPSASGGLPDVWTLPIDLSDAEHPKPGKAEPFLADPQIVEVDPAFSPDGKFIAYASNESGPEEIYVRPFPGPGGKWKISTAGGKFPVFARAARELFFLGGDDRIWVADYTIQDGAFSAGQAARVVAGEGRPRRRAPEFRHLRRRQARRGVPRAAVETSRKAICTRRSCSTSSTKYGGASRSVPRLEEDHAPSAAAILTRFRPDGRELGSYFRRIDAKDSVRLRRHPGRNSFLIG